MLKTEVASIINQVKKNNSCAQIFTPFVSKKIEKGSKILLKIGVKKKARHGRLTMVVEKM